MEVDGHAYANSPGRATLTAAMRRYLRLLKQRDGRPETKRQAQKPELHEETHFIDLFTLILHSSKTDFVCRVAIMDLSDA